MKRHANIPIFIPHLGCPNQCVFCNQRTISGVEKFDAHSVKALIDTALETIPEGTFTEIAFFGGSFTGIGVDLMTELLKVADGYVKNGIVSSIRCSTRPDYISDDILDILKEYGVGTIELGLQSYSNHVLDVCRRGHSSIDEINACRMIVNRGFELVGQMMIGLPGSTLDDELKTAEFIINSGAKATRIYPTVVFSDTELANMTKRGEYIPLTLDDAVYRSSRVLEELLSADISVIRIGLCSQDNLFDEKKYVGGPNHPALGELVIGEMMYNKFFNYLSSLNTKNESANIAVAKGMYSKAIGQKRRNYERLVSCFGLSSLTFSESSKLSNYEFEVEFERK